jgi:tRNA(Ile)-lysidine synthase
LRRADASQAALIAGAGTAFRIDPELLHPFQTIDLTDRRAFVAAVSGGSDSIALLLLARAWLETTNSRAALVAVTVDHCLRQESTAEAEAVAALCGGLGIMHRIMRWEGDKPASGVSAAARDARYRLLAEAAHSAGTDVVLTGHTLDDQIETVAMRGARGEGRGLAGMAPATLFEARTWIVRPLLDMRREALRRFLRQNAIGWADDPTNANLKYERARVRADLTGGGSPGEPPFLIAAAQRARIELGGRATAILRDEAKLAAPGLVRFDPGFPEAPDAEAATYAFRILLAVSGGLPFLPDEARAGALFQRLKGTRLRATLSRTVVDVRKDGIYLRRESRGLPPPIAAIDGLIWDGRFRLRCTNTQPGLTIAPFGAENARKAAGPEAEMPQSLVRAAFAAEPALWSAGEFAGPAAGEQARAAGVEAMPVLAPWARFLPSFDLSVARALAEMLGCAPVPDLPFVGHNEGTMRNEL